MEDVTYQDLKNAVGKARFVYVWSPVLESHVRVYKTDYLEQIKCSMVRNPSGKASIEWEEDGVLIVDTSLEY